MLNAMPFVSPEGQSATASTPEPTQGPSPVASDPVSLQSGSPDANTAAQQSSQQWQANQGPTGPTESPPPAPPKADLIKNPEGEYVSPEGRANRASPEEGSKGYVSPEGQADLSTQSPTQSSMTLASGTNTPPPDDRLLKQLEVLQRPGDQYSNIVQSHASGELSEDEAVNAAKGVQVEQQNKGLLQRAQDVGTGIQEGVKGVGEGLAQVPRLPGQVNEFGKAVATANYDPTADLAAYRSGQMSKEEFDKVQEKNGEVNLPDQATNPDTAKDWQAGLSDQYSREAFAMKHGDSWRPPTATTPQKQMAQREVASAVGGGQSNFWDNVWWASNQFGRGISNIPFVGKYLGPLATNPAGANPELQTKLRELGINIPSGKPMDQMNDEELKSDLLTRSAKLQSQMQTSQGNPQNIGQGLLTPGTPSVGQLEAQGAKFSPEAISGGQFITDPTLALMSIPGIGEAMGLDSILNPAVGAALKGAGKLSQGVGWLTGKISAGIDKGATELGRRAAISAPFLGRIAGVGAESAVAPIIHMGLGTAGDIGGVFMGEELGGMLGRVFRKEIGSGVELAGKTLGDVPRLLSMASQPVTDGLLTASDDLKNGTSNLASKGLWSNLIGRSAESGFRGAGQIGAYAGATAENPEQFGQTLGMGAGLHMALGAAGGADRVVRNTLFDSAFIRDPSVTGGSLGAKPMTYGTDPMLDQQHALAMNDENPQRNQIVNDTRQAMKGAAEIYVLKDQDYRQNQLDLQKKGNLPNPDLDSKGVTLDYTPDQSRAFINADHFDKAFVHEALGHAIDNTLSPADKQAFFDLAKENNDPNQFALNYTKGKADYDSLPTRAAQISGKQQWVPGAEGLTKESIEAEMRAEAISQVANGQSIKSLTTNPTLARRAQMGLGSFLNKMGIDPTTPDAQAILGLKPSFTTSIALEQLIRNGLGPQGAKVPKGAPGSTKPPYVPPVKPAWKGVPTVEPTFRSPELIKDQVTEAFHNNHPDADPDAVQQHLSGMEGQNFGDTYKDLENRMYPGSAAAPKGESQVVKAGSVPDMVKEHLVTMRGFTPEEANQAVSPNATSFTNALKMAIKSRQIANPPAAAIPPSQPASPATSAPVAAQAGPPPAPAMPTIAEDQQPQMANTPTATAVEEPKPEPNPIVQQQLRSEGHNPGVAQQIARGGPIPNQRGNVGSYGYPGDSSWDSKSGQGIGSFPHTSKPGSLIPGYSAALKESAAKMRGVSPGQEFEVNGKIYRYDDTVPDWSLVGNDYVDVYNPSHAPDQGVSAEKIAYEQAVAAGVQQIGERGALSPGEAIVNQSLANLPQAGGTTGIRAPSVAEQPPSDSPPSAPGPRTPQSTVPEGTLPDVRRTMESPILPEEIPQARQDAIASIPQGRKSAQSLADQITQQVAQQVGTEHAQRLGPGDGRVAYNPESGFFSGQRFVPGDAFHQWLLQGVDNHSLGVLKQVEDAIANRKDLHIDYGSAPKESVGTSTALSRAEEQIQSAAGARAKGEAEAQTAGKNVMPSYVGVSLGKKGDPNSVFYGGPSPDKIASNAGQLIQRLGPDSPYKTGPFGDVGSQEDLQGYLHNVTNGWKGDGSAQLESTHNAQVPTQSLDFVPYQLAKEKADFWNLAVQGKGAGARSAPYTKMGDITSSGKSRELAMENKGYVSGETEAPAEVTRAIAGGRSQEIEEAQYRREMELDAQAHKFHLLQEIQRHGGLPSAKRNNELAKQTGGQSYPTGEIRDLHEGWKALDKDSKAYLQRAYGVTAEKLFSANADHPDKLNSRVSQTSETPFENSSDMLSAAGDALATLSDRQATEVKSAGIPEGITNPLHAKIEAETPGWTDQTLHSGWENLRTDLTKAVHDKPEEVASKIHPGHEAVAEALNKEGAPPNRVLHAGFMPGETKNAPEDQTLEDLRNNLKQRGVETDMYEKRGLITLSRIVVPKDQRSQGVGTDAMRDIVDYADRTGQRIGLSPSVDFGASSKSRLEDFYKRFGFVNNKGRNKDFTVSESMIRNPDKQQGASASYMPGETNSIGATVKTAKSNTDEPEPGQWMAYPSSPQQEKKGHIRVGDFEKLTGIKLSKNPDRMIHPMAALLGPAHEK